MTRRLNSALDLCRRLLASLLISLVFSLFAGAANAQTLLNSFETIADMACVKTAYATVSRSTTRGVTDGNLSLEMTFPPADYPAVILYPRAPGVSWDFTQSAGIALDITNPTGSTIKFGIRIQDINGGSQTRDVSIEAHATGTYRFTWTSDTLPSPSNYGVQGLPNPFAGMRSFSMGAGACDYTQIAHVNLFLRFPTAPITFNLDNVRLLPPFDIVALLTGSVDSYGQYTKSTWPGKLKSQTEFASRLSTEAGKLAADPVPLDRNRFGGWQNGPTVTQTGFFKTTQSGGKWWLADPDGKLFFSVGPDTVKLSSSNTIVTGREYMFTWLPSAGDPLAAWNGTYGNQSTYNFVGANIQRKYGADWFARWQQTTLSRLLSWGFNTIGNWSDWAFYGNGRIPYCVNAWSQGAYPHVDTGLGAGGALPDPFDPGFAPALHTSLKAVADVVANDPYCIGYYVDNELSWTGPTGPNSRYGIAYGTLKLDSAVSSAKSAFVAALQAKYSSITALNTAWGVNLASWTALGNPYDAPTSPNTNQKADMSAFVLQFANKYFATVRTQLKLVDSNHLYLGCRFASYWFTPETLTAAAASCDVVSFNIYGYDLSDPKWAPLSTLGKPCIIGEFHFVASDRGLFGPGQVLVPDQQARATGYTNYVQAVLRNPAFVGCHWYQYIDQPGTGVSSSGENGNTGLVDVTDTPYPELISAAQATNSSMYTYRSQH